MSDLQPGDLLGGRYVLEQRLGFGGMGEVWLADQAGAGAFRRRVVLKVLAPERRGDVRLAQMLADEARVVGLLHHPGIVAALDYLETSEHGPIFVLEYVEGASLRTVLKLARRHNALLPETLASYLGAQVAQALHAAHTAVGRAGESLSLVHRDVSPDNVLLSRSGAVYLGDFGVARAAGNSEVTQPGTIKGKVGYMAPEQALGRRLTPAADLFSLGRVIAEAADLNCGPALRAVIDRATAERPEDRYPSAAEMGEALVQAVPPPAAPRVALAQWLRESAPEAVRDRFTTPGETPARSEPPPAGRALPATGASPIGEARLGDPAPLFAAVPPPSRTRLKFVAALAAALFVALPLALIGSLSRGRQAFAAAMASLHPPAHGDLRVSSKPSQAEVYVDGQLRGVTPLLLELPAGHHALRIGTPRLEHWRAAEVWVKNNVEHHLDVDLTE